MKMEMWKAKEEEEIPFKALTGSFCFIVVALSANNKNHT